MIAELYEELKDMDIIKTLEDTTLKDRSDEELRGFMGALMPMGDLRPAITLRNAIRKEQTMRLLQIRRDKQQQAKRDSGQTDVAKHIIFAGSVQGVGFRDIVLDAAGQHNLVGSVRNLDDGTVEAFFQGSSQDIDDGLQYIQSKKVKGIVGGNVKIVKSDEIPVDPKFTEFNVLDEE